jgi:hypothetical protein
MSIDERITVFVCNDCGKLIGTRENYFTERRKITIKKKTYFGLVIVCEGCHVDK